MKKFLRDFEDSMAAAAFAQAGDIETAREIMSELEEIKKEIEALEVKDERVESLLEKHDRTEEAIVFAEAGESDYAREIIRKGEQERKKILVVGGEEGFSDMLLNYAMGMAERMNYDIVTINAIPVGKRLFSFLNDNIREELKSRAEEKVEIFRKEAEKRNIIFSHTVKFGDPDKSIKEAHKEFKRISFILTEPEHVTGNASSRASIPVFCLADV
ncbi:hypothetical protein BMS3Abin07_01512 [bacterium BMS3Abin07]|nr:hypothetical protein BMS3Abin07_01512 [bacterium BMS3Abin07]GBE32633.1 hypothetical protein BMS3Bbin05_01550 [bacterium BMS3Bbin05]HDL20517.1 universal stress protein [Nitrospirota bacterium]HDO23224.1 universal stress protein [Nitrospirota bacterium]HDZ88121.1 universal stress protein [Nitrospirota bacterium]